MIGWMPATFLYIFVCEDCPLKFDWIDDDVKFLVNIVSNCLIILKTLVNPIIYAARMHEIQVSLLGFFGRDKFARLTIFYLALNLVPKRFV